MLLTKTPRTKFVTVLGICALATATISTLHACNTIQEKTPAKTAAPKAVLGQPFTVALQQSVSIPAQKLKLTFERVTDDSRCPAGVECYWSGQATVVVRLEKVGRKAETATLTVQGSNYISDKSIAKMGGYWVKLSQVSPEKGPPEAPGAIQKITLTVQNKAFPAPKNGR